MRTVNFLGPETARWGGGLPREGVVAENFVPALESLSSLGFDERNPGCAGNFAGMSRTPGGVQKVCAKKLRALFSMTWWTFRNMFLIFCLLGEGEGGVRGSGRADRFFIENPRRDTLGHIGTRWDTKSGTTFLCANARKKLKRPNVKIFGPQGTKFPKSIGGELPARPRPKEKMGGGGLNIFFRGRNVHQDDFQSKKRFLLKTLLRTLLRSVRLHDPLGVHAPYAYGFGEYGFKHQAHWLLP